jgi:DNA mismatch endonuclease (patch repair protein)
LPALCSHIFCQRQGGPVGVRSVQLPDIVDKVTRSRMMSGIRGKNTKPELIVRSGLHKRGFRFRLHARLPGRPDLVLPKYRAVIFVNGCFWHGHDCHLFKWPRTRRRFWKKKILGNRAKDVQVESVLGTDQWRRAVIWECALKGRERLPVDEVVGRLASWLSSSSRRLELQGRAHDSVG